jgi:DNA polymerase I-like protein with 3'-5' exonuclease and polymerase domains
MLIHADVKSLELVVAAYLSRDSILLEEIRSGTDIHDDNKTRFGLPDRRIAKIFVFRLLYGGQAGGFAKSHLFSHISTNKKFWQEVIDEFYSKYKGIAKWHEGLVRSVLDKGQLVMPTGRVYSFDRREVASREWYWRSKILNYPVQGTGADLVAIGRVALWKRLRKTNYKVLFVSTVHDSIDLDCNLGLDKPEEVCYNICTVVKKAIEDIPTNFERLFGVPFDLPVGCEIGYGHSLGSLTPFTK